MIRIRVLIRNEVVGEHEFDQARITIGRTPDNDLQLENLALSRRHAEIVRNGAGWRLRDLESKNGFHVNGERCQRHNLNDGDLIGLGKFVLAVAIPAQESGRLPALPPVEELVALGKTVKVDPQEPAPARLERDAPSTAFLTVTHGSPSGLFCLQRDSFVVGSAPGCELRLGGLLTPGRLALIVRGRRGWSLVNVSRKGEGVHKNGKPVRVRAWLEDGDRLELGEVTARFRLGAAQEATQ